MKALLGIRVILGDSSRSETFMQKDDISNHPYIATLQARNQLTGRLISRS